MVGRGVATLVIAVIAVGLAGDVPGWFRTSAILVLFFGLAVAVSSLAHECAHALAALAVGGRAHWIEIGQGPLRGQHRLLGITWCLRRFPGAGITLYTLRGRRLVRLRAWLVAAAGPLSHVALGFAALQALPDPDAPAAAFSYDPTPYVWSLVSLQVALLASTLWPRALLTPFGTVSSDGRALYDLATMPAHLRAAFVDEHRAARDLVAAWQALESHRYEDARRHADRALARLPRAIEARYVRALIEWPLTGPQAAYDRVERISREVPENHPSRLSILNALAWFGLLTGRADLAERADALSAAVFERDPGEPAFRGTRGSVLITRGAVTTGRELVRQALRRSANRFSKALNACFLALAEQQLGRSDRAAAFAARARRLDPDCLLLPRVESVIGRA